MVWYNTVTFQLLTRDYFATFTSQPIADLHETCGAMFALNRDSREEVDAVVAAGVGAGGDKGIRAAMDMGWMYNCAVQDPDGHVLEFVWLDMNAAEKCPEGRPDMRPAGLTTLPAERRSRAAKCNSAAATKMPARRALASSRPGCPLHSRSAPCADLLSERHPVRSDGEPSMGPRRPIGERRRSKCRRRLPARRP